MEATISTIVQFIRHAVEIMGAITIAIGAVVAIVKFARSILQGQPTDHDAIRLTLARYLALALEFQLGADILLTAVAPGWEEIGKLGAIAVIRTGLNYFLSKELAAEEKPEKATVNTP